MHNGRMQVAALILGLLLLWQALGMSGAWPPERVPTPGEVAVAIGRMSLSGQLWAAVWMTLRRVGIGYLCAVLAGGGLGLWLAHSPRPAAVFGPAVRGLETLPAITWYPLALLWFGAGEWALLFVTAVGTFFTVAAAAEAAIRGIPPAFVRAAATLGAQGWGMYLHVIWPAALPTLLAGLRVGWSYAWRSLLAAELLVREAGLGALLDQQEAARIIGVMLVVLLLGLLVERQGFERAERALRLRWGGSPTMLPAPSGGGGGS